MKIFSTFLAISILGLLILFVWTNELFPFSTASSSPAFLGSTFGMSLSEVQRVLEKNEINLTDNVDIITKEFGHYPVFDDAFDFDLVEKNHQVKHWYTHPIQMFNSTVVAEFDFSNNKLVSVTVVFEPIVAKNSTLTISAIESELNKKEKFVRKEFSEEVHGAYSMNFKNNQSIFNLWVNQISDPKKPIILLRINYIPYLNYPKIIMFEREECAFSRSGLPNVTEVSHPVGTLRMQV